MGKEKIETRGRYAKALYVGADFTKVLLKVPMYKAFKKEAKKQGITVTELIYKILLAELSEFENKE